jgi:hypothetical protein
MSIAAALSSLLLTAAGSSAVACNPIPGWDQVLAGEETRVILLGEIHGSNEVPALFADAVCLTAETRPVVVAVEQRSDDQTAIDSFIGSDGGEDARRAFLRARMWNAAMKDGRSSEAYFRLFETLRQMRAAGKIQSVIGFQPASFAQRPTPEEYEKAMADIVLSGTKDGATVVALVGNVHAMRTAVPRDPPYVPMAGHLPPAQIVTLNLVATGDGETWACQGAPVECGTKPSPGAANGHPRGVDLNSGGDGGYSGVLFLGVPTSASPPQPVPTAGG